MGDIKDKKMIRLTGNIKKEACGFQGSMDLDTVYELTVSELGLQQSKRDQIIAFYLTVLGLISPNFMALEMDNIIIGIVFLVLMIVGFMLARVILRYRIYKEVYWIACRVISKLNNIKPECRDKGTIYNLYYAELAANQHTIVEKTKDKKRILPFKSFRKQLDSAETILFETMLILCAGVGMLSFYYFNKICLWYGIAIVCFIIFMILKMNYNYSKRLMELYKCLEVNEEKNDDKKNDAFEKAISKAWMLRFFVDDIIEEKTE